jgi:hypothetical protein
MHFYALLCTFILGDNNRSKNSRVVKVRLGVTPSNPNRYIFFMPELLDYRAHVTYLVTGTLVDAVY